jgi:hypothetical protein
MTVTSRHLEEHPPIAERRIRSPFPNPPPNRRPIARLSFDGPTSKFDCSAAHLVQTVSVSAMADAVLFLDTNIFTRELDQSVWDAFSGKQIFITGGGMQGVITLAQDAFLQRARQRSRPCGEPRAGRVSGLKPAVSGRRPCGLRWVCGRSGSVTYQRGVHPDAARCTRLLPTTSWDDCRRRVSSRRRRKAPARPQQRESSINRPRVLITVCPFKWTMRTTDETRSEARLIRMIAWLAFTSTLETIFVAVL